MTDDDQRPRRRLRGWRLLLAWSAGLLLLLALLLGIGVPIWLRSTSDLGRVDARARALGIAPTWTEAGLTRSAPERIALQEELERLQPVLKSWDAAKPRGAPSPLTPGLPTPPAMTAHHAALDRARMERLLTICDALGTEPVIRDVEMTYATKVPGIPVAMGASKLLAERVVLADDAGLPREIARLLDLAERTDSRTVIGHLVRTAIARLAARAITMRLPALRATGDEAVAIADRLRRMADALSAGTGDACAGEFRCARASLLASGGIPEFMGGMKGRLLVRAGREAVLARLLDIADAARAAPIPRLAAMGRIELELEREDRRTAIPWPSRVLSGLIIPAVTLATRKPEVAAVHLRLVAAELTGTPWPADLLDPGGVPLRRIERDGRVVGAYSVGTDGRDDGGDDKRDERFALHGPLDPPVEAAAGSGAAP